MLRDQVNFSIDSLIFAEEDLLADALCAASWDGQIAEVKRLLALPNATNFINRLNVRGNRSQDRPQNLGQCALYCATRQQHTNIVIELLNCQQIDVNIRSPTLGTPLHSMIPNLKDLNIQMRVCQEMIKSPLYSLRLGPTINLKILPD